ncbi:MAG: YqaA family protein [Rhodocyclaceae bacterium]
MGALAAYGSLFAAAFLAATIFPAQSEALLAGLLLAGHQSAALLVLVASVANVAGSCVNWLLGRYIEHFRHRRWFPVSDARLAQAQQWYRRWGRWSLLLSWAPLIGDPITVAAGLMRESFGVFLAIVAVAKTARYVVLALLVL